MKQFHCNQQFLPSQFTGSNYLILTDWALIKKKSSGFDKRDNGKVQDKWKSIFWHGLTKRKNKQTVTSSSAQQEQSFNIWHEDLALEGLVCLRCCFGEGLREWQRSSQHLNDEVGRTTLTATHRPGFVHFTQIITHHGLIFSVPFFNLWDQIVQY